MHANAKLLLSALCLLGSAAWHPAAAEVLHVFTGGADGALAEGGVITDTTGALYGTTVYGGATNSSQGVVYQLSPPPVLGDPWPETILHAFPSYASDGHYPTGNLLVAPSGTLYGATLDGGAYCGYYGCYGTIFSLTPSATGWTEAVVYSFDDADGDRPNGGLIMDAAGALYGTAQEGGSEGNGTVFKLIPPAQSGGVWTEQTLLNFDGSGNGGYPQGGPIMDANGNLFGTGYHGGPCDCGLVWELSPSPVAPGHWKETIIHQFRNSGVPAEQGYQPSAGLAFGSGGSLYGTTEYGATTATCVFPCATGVVFRLVPLTDHTWQYQVLHSFAGTPDGAAPVASVTLGAQGQIFGTTSAGGKLNRSCPGGCGTAFELTPPAEGGGAWTETVFSPRNVAEGTHPVGPVTIGAGGTLYTTTSSTVLRFTPDAAQNSP